VPTTFPHRQKPSHLWLLMLCLLPLAAYAQGEGVENLADGWRVHTGDDAAWAQPGFDDSGWRSTTLADDAPTVQRGIRWYRMRIDLPAQHGPLALLITGPDSEYQVYVNGVPAPGPRLRSEWRLYKDKERVVLLPAAGTAAELAFRVSYPPAYTELYSLSLTRILLGPVPAIEVRRELARDQRLLSVLPSTGINLALALVGCGALILFLLQRGSREYLWLGLYLILTAISTLAAVATLAGVIPLAFNNLIGDPLTYPALVMQIEFIYAFTGRRVGRAWRVYEGFLLTCIPGSLLVTLQVIPPIAYVVAEGVVNAPVAIMLPILLCAWWVRGNRDAGWLVLPSFLPAAGDITLDLGLIAGQMGWTGLAALVQPIYLGPVALVLDDLADFVFLLAICFVMLLRFTRVSREQARTAAELAAAREIQQRLVPSALPAVAGFRMLAAYLPAQEVGGDFYQVLVKPNGSTFLVVGDVSGKGLRAAMTGALAIGALRTLAAENLRPAALLQRLNLQILSAEDGGFVTCLCAEITRDGAVTAANAGHLSPYLNGAEVALGSGLPLGLTAEAEYTEATLQLAPGDMLTLLSDGVVEARNITGELFGFERTCAISAQSAQQIAEAARKFGQEDDITVLTLTFAPAGVLQP
jgi:phosphoserine phosphatase RsbU/P